MDPLTPLVVGTSTVAVLLIATFIFWYHQSTRKSKQFGPTNVGSEQSIKQGFSIKKVPQQLDMIIIGSGMGGMTVGSIMAKQGKKVLILEQHDVAGGNTHTYTENGFEFDTGLHYVGGMGSKSSPLRRQFDYITNNNVEWEPMDNEYDVAIVQPRDDGSAKETFSIPRGWTGNLIPKLKEAFPDDAEGIDKHFRLARRLHIILPLLSLTRLLPRRLSDLLHICLASSLAVFQQTTQTVLESLTSNVKLQGILSYMFGDYGEVPSRGAFLLSALIWDHYEAGAFYPVGGPTVIAKSVVPVIEKSGGKVLVRAPVSSILVSGETAVGVEVKGHKILAPVIVSSVGAPLTYTRLIPKIHHSLIEEELRGLKVPQVHSRISLMSMFVGLEGTCEELNLSKCNYWVFPSWDHNANWEKYQQDTTSMPAVFISFSSAKDPTYAARHPNKQVALVIAPSQFEDVEAFSSNRVKHRGKDYEELKSKWQEALTKVFLKEFPQLETRIRYVNLGTAISNDFYLGTYRGAVYGMAHTPERFQQKWIHPSTPIKGLYLSGQDVLCCGIVGAMAGGFMTAAMIDKSTLFTTGPLMAG